MTDVRFEGAWTAIVTPFTKGGEAIDEEALANLVEAQIKGGITGLVPCGTTGESPTLSEEEAIRVIRITCEIAKGRAWVFAGTGSNATSKTVAASKAAAQAGVDGVMVVMPYYNKPSQEGMKRHVLEVAKAVDVPVIVYNIPGRSVVDLATDTLATIAEAAPNVRAVKDATGNVLRCQQVKRKLGDRIAVLSGDDGLTLPMMAAGARGVISVTANVRPAAVVGVVNAMLDSDVSSAQAQHFSLLELHEAMFVEPNPAPVKGLLAHEGRMAPDVRLPLAPLSEGAKKHVIETLEQFDRGDRA